MSSLVRWGVAMGILIALVDFAELAILRSLGVGIDTGSAAPQLPAGARDLAAIVEFMNLWVNLGVYFFAGWRMGRVARLARSGAEAGVIAGVIAGLAAGVSAQVLGFAPPPEAVLQAWVQTLALNVAMGGVLGLVGGWAASRSRLL